MDPIITKSVSRFARNTVDSLSTIREHNTEVYFEKENIWTFDSRGELLITIVSSLAQEESRSVSGTTVRPSFITLVSIAPVSSQA